MTMGYEMVKGKRQKKSMKQFFKEVELEIDKKAKLKIFAEKIGDYWPLIQKKGIDEGFIFDRKGKSILKEGDIYWTIRIDKDGHFDTLRQEDAIIISTLVRIERLLRKKK